MKRVLITGGNKGIGLAATKKFLDKKFEVVAVARDFSSFDLKVKQVEFDLANYKNIPKLTKKIGHVDSFFLVQCTWHANEAHLQSDILNRNPIG